ncbi:PREDICTED: conserved oligomeric Golgi complex subunit 1-like, partial [Chinchilla lanigera]|uniref:conserved oligomeric Golgi complex subunit 1-like n=1 Tax=Chinchilla lanigera TaxID=34839 RepID=UPI00038ED338
MSSSRTLSELSKLCIQVRISYNTISSIGTNLSRPAIELSLNEQLLSVTEKVTDNLEALIDPFDLDVFTPYLNSNLNLLVQRTSVLFGLVTGTENQYTPRSSTFNSQEAHNILPLASSQIRFGLLPLSMTSTRKAKSTSRGVETKAQVSAQK